MCPNSAPPRKAENARNRKQAGLTLIEVLVATVVLALAGLIAFPTLLSFFDLSEHAREENIATHDLRAAVEDMMATPFSTLTDTYEDGQPIPKYNDLHLPNERITVEYDDPNTDPISIQLVATWQDSKGRDREERFRFLRTQ